MMKIFQRDKIRIVIIIMHFILTRYMLFSNDLIDVTISPNYCDEIYSCKNVVISITNNFSDTMITFSDFYVEGIKDSVNVQPMLSFFNPNLVLFKSIDKPSIFIDGYIDIFYKDIPYFLVLPPNHEKIIILDNSDYLNELSNDKWNLFTYISAGYKYDLDTLIYFNFPNTIVEYKSKLVYSDTIVINTNSSNKKETLIENNSGNNFDYIKNLFKFKFYSKNIK